MSTQADPVRIPEPNKVKQVCIPDLTDSYRKAHKGLRIGRRPFGIVGTARGHSSDKREVGH